MGSWFLTLNLCSNWCLRFANNKTNTGCALSLIPNTMLAKHNKNWVLYALTVFFVFFREKIRCCHVSVTFTGFIVGAMTSWCNEMLNIWLLASEMQMSGLLVLIFFLYKPVFSALTCVAHWRKSESVSWNKHKLIAFSLQNLSLCVYVCDALLFNSDYVART